MTEPFLAEIRMFAGNFAPTGWALCNGQLMPISQNTALFSLLGVTYGGDGRTTFALPNLANSTPVQQGQGPGLSQYYLGESGGNQTSTVSSAQMPIHTHLGKTLAAPGDSNSPAGTVLAAAANGRVIESVYSTDTTHFVGMSPIAVAPTGGSQPHNNMPPYLALTFIIALQGIFPQRP